MRLVDARGKFLALLSGSSQSEGSSVYKKITALTAAIVIIALTWGFVSASRGAYGWQVYGMTQQCKFEALLYMDQNNFPFAVPECSLRTWDGDQAFFEITGPLEGSFSCHAEEASHAFKAPGQCVLNVEPL